MSTDNSTKRRELNPDELADSTRMGYTQAIVANDRLYMSGQVGWNEDSEFPGDDVRAQTEQAFENVDAILGEVDRSLEDVLKVTAHLVNLEENGDGFLAAWETVYPEAPYPCLTCLGVDQLYGGALVELEVEVAL